MGFENRCSAGCGSTSTRFSKSGIGRGQARPYRLGGYCPDDARGWGGRQPRRAAKRQFGAPGLGEGVSR
jgi:hypothetical protein